MGMFCFSEGSEHLYCLKVRVVRLTRVLVECEAPGLNGICLVFISAG